MPPYHRGKQIQSLLRLLIASLTLTAELCLPPGNPRPGRNPGAVGAVKGAAGLFPAPQKRRAEKQGSQPAFCVICLREARSPPGSIPPYGGSGLKKPAGAAVSPAGTPAGPNRSLVFHKDRRSGGFPVSPDTCRWCTGPGFGFCCRTGWPAGGTHGDTAGTGSNSRSRPGAGRR